MLFTFLANTHGLFLYNKKDVNIFNLFQSTLRKYNRKANKIWVDKGSKIYSNSFKKWLQDNDIVTYSTHNEEKFVVAERLISTLKNKIYKYMSSITKNVYIHKLDVIVNEYNDTYGTIKIMPIDVKVNTYNNVINDLSGEEIIGTL